MNRWQQASEALHSTPTKEGEVAVALAAANLPALTKWDVLGHGKQQGIQVGSQLYQDLSKAMMLAVVEDE